MSERSSSAVTGRFFLCACLATLGLSNAHAQQGDLQLPPSARSGDSAQSQLLRSPNVLLAQNRGASLEIPPVVERPLGLEEGPRVRVSGFQLSGAIDREEQGIFVGDLNTLLNGRVSAQPTSGYTINQLQAIADELTRYYRNRGLILAQAIIPAQDVAEGVVRIQVLEGQLEDVVVEGNRIYKPGVVQGPFRRLQGRPVTQATIERALLDVQEFPGLTVFGTFTQGDKLGQTDLVVRVRDEKRAYFTPSVDNYGSIFTGEIRGLIDFRLNNVFGVADQITGYVLQTFDPQNGTYGGLDFRFPFGRNTIGFGASTNTFDVGGLAGIAGVGVSGDVAQANLYYDRSFANGRFFGANGRLMLAVKNAETEVPSAVLNEDKLTVVSTEFDFFRAGRNARGFTVAEFAVDVGIADFLGSMDEDGNMFSSRIDRDGNFAGGDFTKVRFNLQHLRRVSRNNSLLFRLDGQWTSDVLVALEQFSIGGPQNVRAYSVAEQLADTGGSATLEWLINAPGFSERPIGNRTWGEVFQIGIYYDFAYGELNDPLDFQEPDFDFSGYGLGLQFNVPGAFYGRFDVASPISDQKPINDRDPNYYFRMSYTF